MTTTTLQQQIAEAREAVRVAAAVSYEASRAATRHLESLVAAEAAQQPERTVVVTGNTYSHRRELAALGLRWQPGLHAWTGTVRGQITLPRGCYETSHAEAAVGSMGYADSDY